MMGRGFGVLPLGSDISCEPVFVVGCGRSGTTLLRLILNRHSRFAIFGEAGIFFRDRKYGYLTNPSALRRFVADWTSVMGMHSPHDDLMNAEVLKEGLPAVRDYVTAVSLTMSEFAKLENKPVWGEKTPAHVMRLHKIFAAYPRARVIHLSRDPRAVVCSGIMKLGNGKLTASAVYAVSKYWSRCESQIDRFFKQRPAQVALARYEDLVENPESIVRKLCEFLGVEYEADMLDVAGTAARYAPKPDAHGETLPNHRGLLRDINTDAVEEWRNILSPELAALVEQGAGDWMLKRGYRPSAPPRTNSLSLILRSRIGWVASEVRRIAIELGLPLYWYARAVVKA